MNPIGGYFELELRKGGEYHQEALHLNTGRNAFEYVLRAREYKMVYLPFYTCDAMLEPINKLNLEYEFYRINGDLEPEFDFSRIDAGAAFVYTNYFGLKDQTVNQLSDTCPNLIIDNSQAFFAFPVNGKDTFYSTRKFFGVSDGAYLYTDKLLDVRLEKDISVARFLQVLKRIDEGANAGYADFAISEHSLSNQPVRTMSNLTEKMLESIDYHTIAEARKRNYNYLHEALGQSNKLKIPFASGFIPMVYPYWIDYEGLRSFLIQNEIFVAQYWPNVANWCRKDDLEFQLAAFLLPLPVDQRYGENEMARIIGLIKSKTA